MGVAFDSADPGRGDGITGPGPREVEGKKKHKTLPFLENGPHLRKGPTGEGRNR